MNVTEKANHGIHDPGIPGLIAAPLCLILDGCGLLWQGGAIAVDVGNRIGCWIWLACRHLPKPPDLP